ncbi:TPA: replication/maintenance protein RepL [Staphylococcus aureus]|jgi:DNA-binding HxlR family transcriptional regulator|nr:MULTISPECIES: replication/maintenance protein RepL [Staphylococcus]MDU6694885.1 replication/maintenance protein RepL [Enterococcus faecalis]EWH99813.1 replication and maintenance protein [Staphylococcus aureus M46058]EWI61344.1 replication and maintenance protein [Staphylococcus aureus T60805]EWJ92817.1 replication and maintenance protein [Staphylococcus aureus W81816]EWX68364.1 replication and maintenance protein [Staphylococcus aureus M55878]
MRERYGTVYKGSQRLIDEQTGEVIEVDKLYRKQTSGNFVKAYIVQLISMLDMIGGKKLKIVNYILDNVHLSNNIIVTTTREIAKATNTSTQTVTRTLKILEEGNIIKRRTGALMLNPELLMRGDDQKQKYLLLEFGNFEQEATEKQDNALSEYYSFKE